MSITTKYLTNTSNFEEIAEKLRTAHQLPDQVDKKFLTDLGYSNQAYDLILNFFKDLNFLDEENSPTGLLQKFRQTDNPQKVFAHSILIAYGELFEKDPTIHQQSKEEIKQQLHACLDEEKSSIIINYMANTFKVLVDYAGHETIAEVWEKKNADIFSLVEQQETDIDITDLQLEGGNTNREIAASVNGTGNGTNAEPAAEKDGGPDPDGKEPVPEQADNEEPEGKTNNASEKKAGGAEEDQEPEEATVVEYIEGQDEEEESSRDLTAKEAIRNIEEMTVEDAKEFVDADDDRVTVQRALKDKIEAAEETETEERNEEIREEFQTEELTSLNLTLPAAPDGEGTTQVNRTDYIHRALIKRAELLYKLGRFEEALPALDKVYQKFADARDDELYKAASVALIKKKNVAEKLQLHDYLIPIYTTIIDRWDTREEKEFTPFIDQAYLNVTEILLENDQIERALDIIEQAIQRFKDTKRKSDNLAKVMYTKAELLEKSGSDQKALQAFDEVVENFSSTEE